MAKKNQEPTTTQTAENFLLEIQQTALKALCDLQNQSTDLKVKLESAKFLLNYSEQKRKELASPWEDFATAWDNFKAK